MANLKPFKPMSPILTDRLPEGPEWTYQLKWDGYRLMAYIEQGQVRLLSKNMHVMNHKYPEIAEACARLPGTLVLDGEAVVMDLATGRPNFQKMQQRSKAAGAADLRDMLPIQYIVFDVLQIGGEDLKPLPFSERDRRLRELAKGWQGPLYTTDCFDNGQLLWEWAVRHGWEGVVCKRRVSPYREGKAHRDWYKRKAAPQFDVEIVGIVWRDGRIASLVMKENGVYFGRVAAGLNGKLKEKLRPLGSEDQTVCLLPEPPALPKGDTVRWLREPIAARVTGTEVTMEGILRHPKLISLDI
jgi:bifunctional non-homologous end joining protein LigD